MKRCGRCWIICMSRTAIYFKELSMYILAVRKEDNLEEVKNHRKLCADRLAKAQACGQAGGRSRQSKIGLGLCGPLCRNEDPMLLVLTRMISYPLPLRMIRPGLSQLSDTMLRLERSSNRSQYDSAVDEVRWF